MHDVMSEKLKLMKPMIVPWTTSSGSLSAFIVIIATMSSAQTPKVQRLAAFPNNYECELYNWLPGSIDNQGDQWVQIAWLLVSRRMPLL